MFELLDGQFTLGVTLGKQIDGTRYRALQSCQFKPLIVGSDEKLLLKLVDTDAIHQSIVQYNDTRHLSQVCNNHDRSEMPCCRDRSDPPLFTLQATRFDAPLFVMWPLDLQILKKLSFVLLRAREIARELRQLSGYYRITWSVEGMCAKSRHAAFRLNVDRNVNELLIRQVTWVA